MTTWTHAAIHNLYNLPFTELLYQAQLAHRQFFNPQEVQICTLLNVKTGACPEDCGYCAQSIHYQTGIIKEKLMSVEQVIDQAKMAKAQGASRFCMAAAWRSPTMRNLLQVAEMIKAIKALGLETCVTLGMLTQAQADILFHAGLDYYNHNLDTSPEYYKKVITTRVFQDRLDTLKCVANAGIKMCSGGIIGMGESRNDRVSLLFQLVNLPKHPESVPINRLAPIKGTPLADKDDIDNVEFIRTIAVARILMPRAYVRLSAGRNDMPTEVQALCFMAGANSIFSCDKLLTVDNPGFEQDRQMFSKLGLMAV